ncbi:MAG: hypothetical protein FWE27_00390 [Defluviitaleaceae bacterium]|nr:hypothetical protein [Defluviitaleaceae bacterium]
MLDAIINVFEMKSGITSKPAPTFKPPCDEDENETACDFLLAIEEYQDKILRGLNSLTDEDIKKKIQDFDKEHMPACESPAQLKIFLQKRNDFITNLRKLQNIPNESLISFGGKSDEDEGNLGFMQSKILSNPGLQQQLQS